MIVRVVAMCCAQVPNAGTAALLVQGPFATGCVVGAHGTDSTTVVSGNTGNGIGVYDVPGSNLTILNTLVGVSLDGTTAVPNTGVAGVYVHGTTSHVTVGSLAGESVSVISGNTGFGVYSRGKFLRVFNAIVGMSTNGTAVPNMGRAGIYLGPLAASAVIGSSAAPHATVVSGNAGVGIYGLGKSLHVTHTLVGLSADNTAAANEGSCGIHILPSAAGSTVSYNTVSGNSGSGILVAAPNVSIYGNTIGLGSHRRTAVGNGGAGVSMSSTAVGSFVGGPPNSTRENMIGANGLLAIQNDAGAGVEVLSNVIPARGSPLGNGRFLAVCARCLCCSGGGGGGGRTTTVIDCRPSSASSVKLEALSPGGRCSGTTGTPAQRLLDIGANALTQFPADSSIARLSERGMTKLDWHQLSVTGASLETLDLSYNANLDPVPPGGYFDGRALPSLTSLNLAHTNISRLRNNTFQKMNRALLVELDLSRPATGAAPAATIAVNLTGFSNLGVVSWYNNVCPQGFFAMTAFPSRKDDTLCLRCPIGTYSARAGGVSKVSCSPCPDGRFDLDKDPTTPCAPPRFKVLAFTRSFPPGSQPGGAEPVVDRFPEQTYTVGVPYVFAPVQVVSTGGIGRDGNTDNDNITFTVTESHLGESRLGGARGSAERQSHFLIDPTSGMLLGTPANAGVYNVTLFALDGFREVAHVQTITITAVAAADPGSAGKGAVLAAALVVSVALLAMLAVAASKWQAYQKRNQPYDFGAILAQLQQEGVLDENADVINTLEKGAPLYANVFPSGRHSSGGTPVAASSLTHPDGSDATATATPPTAGVKRVQEALRPTLRGSLTSSSSSPVYGRAVSTRMYGVAVSGVPGKDLRVHAGTCESGARALAAHDSKCGAAAVDGEDDDNPLLESVAAGNARSNRTPASAPTKFGLGPPISHGGVQLQDMAGSPGPAATAGARLLIPREISNSHLTVLDRVGGGNFGDVYRGMLNERATNGLPSYHVAIKTPSPDADGTTNKKDLLQEAALMAQFNHPNIVALIGVVSRNQQCKVVLQFCDKGSLQSLLRHDRLNDGHLAIPSGTALRVASEIAEGMAYLESKRFVHRDLATRNILVDAGNNCLVADFGLSRALHQKDYYKVREGAVLPIRWCAPEILTNCSRATSASDVWSFFVLMWEVWSRAQLPYGTESNMQVTAKLEDVAEGKVDPQLLLAPPDAAGIELYRGLQGQCWCVDPRQRASFVALGLWLQQQRHQLGHESNASRDSGSASAADHAPAPRERVRSSFSYSPTRRASSAMASSDSDDDAVFVTGPSATTHHDPDPRERVRSSFSYSSTRRASSAIASSDSDDDTVFVTSPAHHEPMRSSFLYSAPRLSSVADGPVPGSIEAFTSATVGASLHGTPQLIRRAEPIPGAPWGIDGMVHIVTAEREDASAAHSRAGGTADTAPTRRSAAAPADMPPTPVLPPAPYDVFRKPAPHAGASSTPSKHGEPGLASSML